MQLFRNILRSTSLTPQSLSRSAYKETWEQLASTKRRAIAHIVAQDATEEEFSLSGKDTAAYLGQLLQITREDIVLEIGCGIGRTGLHLAPQCKEWIGTDVSTKMLRHAETFLSGNDNIRLIETSGYDLSCIPDESVDVVICTVVFMHLDSWDRYSYIEEAMRILRAEGRLYADTINLCSTEGWEVFKQHRGFHPKQRPPHISKCSTPDELQIYFQQAGFSNIQLVQDGAWIRALGKKTAP